jgi:hypothetical protein
MVGWKENWLRKDCWERAWEVPVGVRRASMVCWSTVARYYLFLYSYYLALVLTPPNYFATSINAAFYVDSPCLTSKNCDSDKSSSSFST